MLKIPAYKSLKYIVLSVVMLLISLTGALAASRGDCAGRCVVCGDDPVCGTIYENCINACMQGSGPMQAPGIWGAIAVSKSSDFSGSSWNCQSKQEAQNLALKYCWQAMNAMRDCNVVGTFANTCVALATSPKEHVWGYSGGYSSVKLAAKNAMKRCRNAGGLSCAVVSKYCSPKAD